MLRTRVWASLMLAGSALVVGPVAPAAAELAPPPLDPRALRAAISGLPDATVTAAQLRVEGSDGHWSGRSGVNDLVSDRPVVPGARFRVGSATKTFTAVAVLQLAAEGKVSLDRPLQDYLPGLLPSEYPPVLVGQLLDHTSGLPDSTEDAGLDDPAAFVAHRFDHHSPREVVASAVRHPMSFRPGTAQDYNGVNYFVAGLLVEKVTGRTYGQELRDRVLRPLHLRDTYLPEGREVHLRGLHARGYVMVAGTPVDITSQSPYAWAEGGLVSTTADLSRFMRALFRGRLLEPEQVHDLFAVPDVPYQGDSNCSRGPDAGRACFSKGLTRTHLPNGVVVWGKSGAVAGTTTAMFGTRNLGRVMTYGLHPTGNRDGTEGERIQRIVAATFVGP